MQTIALEILDIYRSLQKTFFRISNQVRLIQTSLLSTVNSEIFARVYCRETSHMRSFVKIKSSRNGLITLSLTDEGKSCHSREYLRRKYVF